MRPWHFLLIALASYRTTVLVIDDRVPFGPLRDWIWARWPYGDEPQADDNAGQGWATRSWFGRRWVDRHRAGLARVASWWKNSWGDRVRTPRTQSTFGTTMLGSTKIGWLFTCPWCMGVWCAASWWVAWLRWPTGTLQWAAFAAAAAIIGGLYELVNT